MDQLNENEATQEHNEESPVQVELQTMFDEGLRLQEQAGSNEARMERVNEIADELNQLNDEISFLVDGLSGVNGVLEENTLRNYQENLSDARRDKQLLETELLSLWESIDDNILTDEMIPLMQELERNASEEEEIYLLIQAELDGEENEARMQELYSRLDALGMEKSSLESELARLQINALHELAQRSRPHQVETVRIGLPDIDIDFEQHHEPLRGIGSLGVPVEERIGPGITAGTITVEAFPIRPTEYPGITIRGEGIDSIRLSDSPVWLTPKRYVFDESKITNTVSMLRAFNAILSRFNFGEDEIQDLGIKDLVIEQTSNGISF